MERITTKRELFADTREAGEIDVSIEPDAYFAKLAIEYNGSAVRDNTFAELVKIGLEIVREES